MSDSTATAPARGGYLRALSGPPQEIWLGVVATVIATVVTGYLGRDFWFRYDLFYFLADRDLSSLDDVLRPHAGHWATWTTVLFQGLYHVFGMDYWPWFYVPRLLGRAAVSFLIWRVLRHRGTDPLLAAGAFGAVLFLATSYFHDSLNIGHYVVSFAVVTAALFLHEVDHPQPRHLLLLGALLLAAVMGNGYGPTTLLGVILVALAIRRFRQWAPALVPPAVAYAVWYLHYRSSFPDDQAPLNLRTAVDSIEPTFITLRTTVEANLGLPGALASVVVVAIGVFLVWLLVRRRLDTFDAVIATTLALTLVSLAVTRSVPRPEFASQARYGYAIALLLILLVVPHLPVPSAKPARLALATVLVAILAFNVVSLDRRIDQREVISQEIRTNASTLAAFMAAGEPYVSYARLPLGIKPWLIQELVDDGWRPEPSTDRAVRNQVRVRMRIANTADKGYGGLDLDPGVAPAAEGVEGGCLALEAGETVDLEVGGEGLMEVDGRIQITWTDPFGTVRRNVSGVPVGLAAPVGDTEVRAVALDDRATLCGLQPLGPSPDS